VGTEIAAIPEKTELVHLKPRKTQKNHPSHIVTKEDSAFFFLEIIFALAC
jgi:hypothetical protein